MLKAAVKMPGYFDGKSRELNINSNIHNVINKATTAQLTL